ncbi:MAG: rod shape-determining protein MreC [Candidatus Omnitrophica bacterium]|nr:rod shape-determining protein MreC [Candidatus Omnitrophota bacterium]
MLLAPGVKPAIDSRLNVFKLSRKTLISFILIASCLFLISNTLSCFKNSIQGVFTPGLSFVGLLKHELSGIIFYHRNMIQAENLNAQVGALRWQLSNLQELNQENARLKGLLNFKQKSPLRLVAARVIARSLEAWSCSVIIDKGKNNRIRPGMAVIDLQGLVGRVVESLDNASKVLLINDSSQGISSIVQRSRQEGLVSGTLGSNLIMRYLPEDAQITVGDLVITSDLSQIYPKGLVIGKVINIGSDFSGLNRFAVVKPAVELANIEEVFVIIP